MYKNINSQVKIVILLIVCVLSCLSINAQGIISRKKITQTTKNHNSDKSSKKKIDNRTSISTISTSQCVDLGLSVKWAGYNVGASRPEEAGNYYAWGELSPKSDYSQSTYKYYNGGDYLNKDSYTDIGSNISGNLSYDVARVQWGYPWRMPTKEEISELLSRCIWTWTTYRGINGYKVTGPNGNAIFLPAAGILDKTWHGSAGSHGFYWSSTHWGYGFEAYKLIFNSDCHEGISNPRCSGLSVRPVSE